MSVKLSVFTPAHRVDYLEEAYDSLLAQDHENWEWLIVPHGSLRDPVPQRIMRDGRVKTASDPHTSHIGALKLHACQACTGDAFVELDSDDLLVPGTLSKVARAIEDGAGFVYSDSAVFNDGSLETWAYHPSHGWESYDLHVYERAFKATRCFDLTPRSLCEVYYAPDHVRVWSRRAYEKTGGHDPILPVADDHDLICRTYLAGIDFHYLDCCGYLYRFHRSNTVKTRSRQIQRLQNINRQKYIHDLAAEWARRQGLQTAEISPLLRSKQWQGGTPLPYPDNSLGQLIAWDCLQYLRPEHQVPFFNEAYRVLAPAGMLHLSVPSSAERYQDQDPRHLSRFNANSFLYYTARDFASTNPDIGCRFQSVQLYEGYPNDSYRKCKMKMLFTDLCALKGQRQPGPQLI